METFSERYAILKRLLNEAQTASELYTDEYIADRLCCERLEQFRAFVNGVTEPDKQFKQAISRLFGVNEEWIVYGRGLHPFAVLRRGGRQSPMDILKHYPLSNVEKIILAIGKIDGIRELLIIFKESDVKYVVHPYSFPLNSNVGAAGVNELVEVYRFIRECDRRDFLWPIVYYAEESEFYNLSIGDIYPKVVLNFCTVPFFVQDFLDLNKEDNKNTELWDNDLMTVKRIIRSKISNSDFINQKFDLELIDENIMRCVKSDEKDERTMNVTKVSLAEKKYKPVIFISHATEDSKYVRMFVELLHGIGVDWSNIICTSYQGNGVPLNNNIYDWLRDRLSVEGLHIIYFLSRNYYRSVSCLNEMGAGWVTRSEWDGILLPGFDFAEIDGCIDKAGVLIKLDNDEVKYRLTDLKDKILDEMHLENQFPQWEMLRDDFLTRLNELTCSEKE